jgi:hypothetical protein
LPARHCTVTWAKATDVIRYEVSYRRKGASKWQTTSVAGSKTSAVVGRLSKGKAYQFKVRGYVTVAGANYYSAWSAIKTGKSIR